LEETKGFKRFEEKR
jgi:hypothetical protein